MEAIRQVVVVMKNIKVAIANHDYCHLMVVVIINYRPIIMTIAIAMMMFCSGLDNQSSSIIIG